MRMWHALSASHLFFLQKARFCIVGLRPTWPPSRHVETCNFRISLFLPNSVLNLTNHVLLDRCGEAIVVLNEGFLHINQAAHLAKVSATYLRLISFVSLVIFKETNK